MNERQRRARLRPLAGAPDDAPAPTEAAPPAPPGLGAPMHLRQKIRIMAWRSSPRTREKGGIMK
eukprot:5133787-Pyramimonas_sp.AAC.1